MVNNGLTEGLKRMWVAWYDVPRLDSVIRKIRKVVCDGQIELDPAGEKVALTSSAVESALPKECQRAMSGYRDR